MHWQELLVGRQARVTQLGLAYDCPLHVGTPGTLYGIDVGTYAPVYFCTVCHRSFPAREMAVLLGVRTSLPPEEPVTYWLWRVRGSTPTPYWNFRALRQPLAKHAVTAAALSSSIDALQAPHEQRQRIVSFLRGAYRGSVVFVHTAGYDGVATSLSLSRQSKTSPWPSMSLRTGITGFLPAVTAGGPVVLVPDVSMATMPPMDLASVGIAGSPRFTHADGELALAVDWRGTAACAVTRTVVAGRMSQGTVAVVGKVTKRHHRRPVIISIVAWLCAAAVAKAVGSPIRLRITVSKRMADILIDNFGWYKEAADSLGMSIASDRHTRLSVTVGARNDDSGRELHLDIGSTQLKNVSTAVWPPSAHKLRRVVEAATDYVRACDSMLPSMLGVDNGRFMLGLVTSLSKSDRSNSRVRYRLTTNEHAALLALSRKHHEAPTETP